MRYMGVTVSVATPQAEPCVLYSVVPSAEVLLVRWFGWSQRFKGVQVALDLGMF